MTSRSLSSALSIAAFTFLTIHALAAQTAMSGQVSPPLQPVSEGFGAGAYRPQFGVSEPVPLRKLEPQYTADAMRAGIQGEVELEVVIKTDGSVGPLRVVKSLPFGLDQQAIRAAEQWLFRPAIYNSKPVPMVTRLILEFRHPSAPYRPQPTPQGGDPTWIDDAEFLKGVARLGQPNVTMPILLKSVEPKYTSDAMRAKVMGTVTVDMVVGIDGSVMRSRIVRSLDKALGLDREALAAARQWQFKAGLVNGTPAPVLVTATLEFRLH